jgi:hypothetical protein
MKSILDAGLAQLRQFEAALNIYKFHALLSHYVTLPIALIATPPQIPAGDIMYNGQLQCRQLKALFKLHAYLQ